MLCNKYQLFSGSLIFLGLLGLLVSLLGEVTTLGEYKSLPPSTWEKFDQELVIETPNLILLEEKISSSLTHGLTEQEKMMEIYKLVIRRFTHGDQAKYNIFSNWLIWLIGELYTPASYIRNPDVLVEKGFSALCNEQSYLLQKMAEAQGIRTRKVGLNGHVVMEAWYDNDWHLFDPDLEVVPLLDDQQVLSLDDLARSPELIRRYYTDRGNKEYIQSIVDIISTREDNSFVLYWMIEKHIAYFFEKIANIMKWIFPLILLVTGFGLYFRKTRNR